MDDITNPRPTRYWIFQAKREVYSLVDLLQAGEAERWRLLRFEKKLRIGDPIYFWQAGSEEAILGWGVVEGEPYIDTDNPKQHRVPVRYKVRLSEPLTRTALQNDQWLWSLSILRSPEGANFAVTTEQALALNRILRSQDQEAPPDPTPFLPAEILLDGDLSGTTNRIVREAGQWTTAGDGAVPALSSSLLLFAFVRSGLTSSRDFLDTSRFLAQQAEEVDQYREDYLQGWSSDPELALELAKKSGSSEPSATLAAALVLSAATRIAVATTRSPKVSLRHLLGAFIESKTLTSDMGAQRHLEEAGIKIPELRREFIKYLRQYHPSDSIGAWERVLLAPDEQISMLANYDSDLPEGDDMLGIGAEVDALASLVAARDVVPPLSIGIFGDWGSGKSFFMEKMIDRVSWICNNLSDDTSPDELPFYRNIVQIRFNAWNYSESNIWASLVTHIFDNLRLSVEGESDDDVAKRRQLILAELQELKRQKKQVKHELQVEQGKLGEKKAALATAESEAERYTAELDDVQKRDVLDALTLTPRIRALFAGAQQTLGLEGVAGDAREVYEAVQQVHTIGGQAQALWLSVLNSEGWKRRLVWLGTALVAFVVLSLVVNSPWFDSSNQTWQEVKTYLAGSVSLLGVGAGWLAKHMKSAQKALDLLQQADKEFSKQMDSEREKIHVDLGAKKLELEAQLKRVETVRCEVERAELAVAEKEAEIRDLEPDRLFARFIEERALSNDYRKELGIISMVRKDFEKLADFLSREDTRARSDVLAIDRIILYIDDLDRCPEDTVVKVLQAVHLLLGLKLFVVVVAVDARWIRRSLVKRYGALIQDARPHLMGSKEQVTSTAATSEDYLEKIFQVPFWIRPMGETGAQALVKHLLRRDMESMPGPLDETPQEPEPTPRHEDDAGPPEDVPPGETPPDEPEEVDDAEARPSLDPAWILEPQRLSLKKYEFNVINQLAPLIGRSPRAVKRFVNVYRVLRAGLHREELANFLGENRQTPCYPAALLLLAVLNGSPSLATEIFHRLAGEEAGASFEAFISKVENDPKVKEKSEWHRFFGFLAPFTEEWGNRLKVGLFQRWAPRVARYSFRMEMATDVDVDLLNAQLVAGFPDS